MIVKIRAENKAKSHATLQFAANSHIKHQHIVFTLSVDTKQILVFFLRIPRYRTIRLANLWKLWTCYGRDFRSKDQRIISKPFKIQLEGIF
jgi:hypothetical protein